MTTFYLCRHGQTENNKRGRLSGWIDTPLTELGIQNALTSASKLQNITINTIISSDLGRAFMTAYIIARKRDYTSEIETNAGLREVDYGNKANMSIAEVIASSENIDLVNADGETLEQMKQRVLSTLSEISKSHPDQAVLLVAHDGTINAVYSSLLDQDVSVVGKNRVNPHDFVARFMFSEGSVTTIDEL
jgi:broad specificity phosphatase PhoE